MSIKFEKYWNMSNIALAMTCFLDPNTSVEVLWKFVPSSYILVILIQVSL
jgi:hypothetical protein